MSGLRYPGTSRPGPSPFGAASPAWEADSSENPTDRCEDTESVTEEKPVLLLSE